MNSNRLLQISLFIDYNDSVIDVGCDHALLDIYLVQNKLCKKTLASDISENALNQGIENIKKYDLASFIPTIVSDGLNNIDVTEYNTLVISGMGAHTITDILKNKKKIANINKIILSSNNDHVYLRKKLNKIGYYLEDEKIVFDKNHYYPVMKFIKSKKKNKRKELKYGFLRISNIPYYENYIKHNNEIKKMLKKHWIKKIKLSLDNCYYQKYIKKITGKKIGSN